MKKIVGISLFIFWAFVTAFLTAGLVFYDSNKIYPRANSLQDLKSKVVTNAESKIFLNTEEIAKHSLINDCWLIIDRKVYDVSSYIGAHPGGATTIIPYCGKEATKAFSTKETGSSHSEDASNILASYYIGDLNQIIVSAEKKQDMQNEISSQSKNSASFEMNSSPAPSMPVASQTILSVDEISKHFSSKDCWIIMSGKVYNITSYLPYHPGGAENISSYCGKDANQAFQAQGHSSNAGILLSSYYIGDLDQSVNTEKIQQTIQNTENLPLPERKKKERDDDDDEYEDEDD